MDTIIELDDALDTAVFYGVNNSNMLCLANQYPDVRIVARGYQVKVTGAEEAVTRFQKALRACETFCVTNNTLTENHILQIIHEGRTNDVMSDNLILYGMSGKPVKVILSLLSDLLAVVKRMSLLLWQCVP